MTRALASSPDTSPEELLELAWEYPREILKNPLLPLLSVESPALWLTLLTYISGGLRSVELRDATSSQRQLLSQQIKQIAPALTAELQLVKDAEYHRLWDVVLRRTLHYKNVEESFAEIFCLSILGTSQMHFTTPERTFEVYLFETRVIEERRVELPYYVVECWAGEESLESGCVELEQVFGAACAWLFDGFSFEALRDEFFSQKLALDRLRGQPR